MMKWSRVVYCAAITALMTFLVTRGTTPWVTVPLGAFTAWWTVTCSHALWGVASLRVAAWRLHQAPSPVYDWSVPRKVKRLEWLSNPRLDSLVKLGTGIAVLGFSALLWLPLAFWLFG
jgi:hypothetical protein